MRAEPATHHPNTPNHTPPRPHAHRPSKPATHKPASAPTHKAPTSHDKGGTKPKHSKKEHKSAPEAERTMPIGSGARVSIASLGKLPATHRRH